MNYNRDEVRKLEREIEETSDNRFRPYRVGGGTVSEDLVVRIAEKKVVLHEGRLVLRDPKEGFWSFFGAGGKDLGNDELVFARRVVESAIREALLSLADEFTQKGDPYSCEAARLIREAAREGTKG